MLLLPEGQADKTWERAKKKKKVFSEIGEHWTENTFPFLGLQKV